MSDEIKWVASDNSKARFVGILEFKDRYDNWHDFHILELPDRFLFGGCCNVGFLESGYILREEDFDDDVLQELLLELETYYNDGKQHTTKIVCNERM